MALNLPAAPACSKPPLLKLRAAAGRPQDKAMTLFTAPIETAPEPAQSGSRRAPADGPLRVAIVGAGKMARHHAVAVGRTTAAAVVAVADPAPVARAELLTAAPGAAEYDSLSALLAGTQVDIVHICTPPSTHGALAYEAIAAGCHVYVEKPFVESIAEAESILAAAERTGVQLCAGHQLLYEAPARRARALLPALGELTHIESYFSFRTVRRTLGGRAPLRADLQLLDILPHPVYLLLDALEQAAPSGRTELVSLQVGRGGTVHALVRRGPVTATLVVTLEGRPVESYLRLVGTNGAVHADFVRGTVQQLIGPGTSGIDKVLAPYRTAAQLIWGTTTALAARVLRRQRSYPGLAELFHAFYAAVRSGGPSPVGRDQLLDTTRIWEQVARALAAGQVVPADPLPERRGPRVTMTGGTGFLGRAVVEQLAANGARVRVLARREPAGWERVPGADYVVADLGGELTAASFAGSDVVIHAAAETAGGWPEHQRNSIDATVHVLRAAAAAGVRQIIHVSSIAVLQDPGRLGLSEGTPLLDDPRSSGPYVWGKAESEREAQRVAEELGLDLKVVRPGAIVDARAFEPPGRLGKRLGGLFVAVGWPGQRLGVVELQFAARVLGWMVERFDEVPSALNLLDPEPPTKRELLGRLRSRNPGLWVVWLPPPVLRPLSWVALLAQKVLRPGCPAINVAKVFAVQRYDTTLVRMVAAKAGSRS